MWSRFRAKAFARRSLGGWVLLVIWIGWEAVDAWGNFEFATSKWPAIRAVLQTAWATTTAPLSSDRIQWVVLLAGLTWVVVATMRPEKAESSRHTTTDSRPSVTRSPDEQRKILRALLHHSYQHGDAIGGAAPDHLIRKWAKNAQALIKDALGEDEAELFISEWEWQNAHMSYEWMNRRMSALYNLMKRVQFMKIRDEFDIDDWMARMERGE